MLVALNNDKLVDLLHLESKEHWRRNMRTEMFVCPVCKSRVIPKCGTKKVWHFAHSSQLQCKGEHEAETYYHLLGKKSLYYWLKSLDKDVILEHYMDDIIQRPDLFMFDDKHAVEFQCASMSKEVFIGRIEGYNRKEITCDWVFGLNRVNRVHPNVFKIHGNDLLAAKKDEEGRLYLQYFCPLKQQFMILYNILPLTNTKVASFAIKKSLKHQFILQDLLKEKAQTKYPIQLWNSQKVIWRMTAYKNQLPSALYVKKILYKTNRSISLFSPLAGIPTKNYYHMETSPFLWQSYLLFMIDKNKGPITLENIVKEFKRLINQEIFVERELPYTNDSFIEAVKGYLDYLESENIIVKNFNGVFEKGEPIPYPETMDSALEQDKIFSKKGLFFDFL